MNGWIEANESIREKVIVHRMTWNIVGKLSRRFPLPSREETRGVGSEIVYHAALTHYQMLSNVPPVEDFQREVGEFATLIARFDDINEAYNEMNQAVDVLSSLIHENGFEGLRRDTA